MLLPLLLARDWVLLEPVAGVCAPTCLLWFMCRTQLLHLPVLLLLPARGLVPVNPKSKNPSRKGQCGAFAITTNIL
jgi:hypothetical protein